MKRLLSTVLLLAGLSSVCLAVSSQPPSIYNQHAHQQNAEANIDTITVTGTSNLHKVKFDDGSVFTSTAGLGGGNGTSPYTNATASTTLTNPFGTVTSTLAVTSTMTVQKVIIAGSGANQITTSAGLLDATKLTGIVPNTSFPATLPAASGANLTSLNAGSLTTGTVPDAAFPATLPVISGVNLTNLNASNLASGTVPNGRFPATLPVASGANLTSLNASNLASGTVPDAAFPATLPGVSGAALTSLNASNLTAGTLPDARFPATIPAASGVNLTNLNATNLASGTVPDARFPATLPSASGANLTSLNASNLGTGTVPDARFPATLPALSGVNLTALNASNLGSGTLPVARTPALVGAITMAAGSTTTVLNIQISPSTGVAPGILPATVQVSSVGAGVVGDAQISAVASSKITGSISIANGGTGQSTYTDGQLLIGNTSGNTLSKATLTAGSNVTITNGNGSITVNASTAAAGPFTQAKSSTTIDMNNFAVNNVSTNTWTNATINGTSTYWNPPPTSSTSTFFAMFTGSQVSYPTVLQGVETKTSSDTVSGYRVFGSTVVLPSTVTASVAGAISYGSTDGDIVGNNGSSTYVVGHSTQNFSVFITSGTGWDNLVFPIASPSLLPIHITQVRSTVLNGTSLTFNLNIRSYGSLNSGGSNITGSPISAAVAGTITSGFSSTAVGAFGHLVFTTSTSAAAGSVDGVLITVYYTEDVR